MGKTEKDCVFCRIAKGEISCERIYEDKDFMVILDAFPILRGQILIITKKHLSDYAFNLNDSVYSDLMRLAKKFANILDKTFNPIKTGMIIEGLEVPHVHIKLLPLTSKEGYGLKPIKPQISEKELKKYAERIRGNL